MKAKILLAILLFLANIVMAQSYYILPKTGTNNEAAGVYTFTDGSRIVMQGKLAPFGDTLTAWQKLPFNWNFFGKPVKGYFISDNGYISFDSAAKGSNPNNTSLPDASAPKNAIFGFWDALVTCDPDGSSDLTNLIHTWTYGTAPNRVHVIHWFRSFRGPYTSALTSQFNFGIRLYESGPKAFDIVYDYRLLPSGGTIVATDATVGCQNSDGTTATMVAGSPSFVYPAVGADKSDDVVYEFYNGTQSALDMSVIKLNITDIAKPNYSVPIKGTLRNFGSDNIYSLTLNYRVDGGATVSELINSLSIAPGNTYDFEHSDIYNTSPTETNSVVEVWASGLNGSSDQNNSNDTMKTTIQVVPKSAVRLPLHEVFTSSTCPPCNPANANLKIIFDNNPDKYTCVKYQESWPGDGDPYYTTECLSRSQYYGSINSVPTMFLDGGSAMSPSSYNQALFDQLYETPSFVDIDAKYTILPYQYDATDTTVKIDVTITPFANFIGYKPKLYMAIVESITTRNAKSNGETEFYYVLKKMVPNPTGTTLAKLEKDKPQTITKSYTFKGKYKLPPDAGSPINLLTQNSVEDYNNLLVVAWIQDDNTLKVLQSTWGRFPTSIRDESRNAIIKGFYPNPVCNQANVQFRLEKPENVSFEVVNMLGQSKLVLEKKNYQPGDLQITLPLSDLKPGAYILLIKTDNGISSVRFIK